MSLSSKIGILFMISMGKGSTLLDRTSIKILGGGAVPLL